MDDQIEQFRALVRLAGTSPDQEAVDMWRRLALGQIGNPVPRPGPCSEAERDEIIAEWRALTA